MILAAEDLMEENLVAAEPSISNVAKKRAVLPPRIERHSEDVVLMMPIGLDAFQQSPHLWSVFGPQPWSCLHRVNPPGNVLEVLWQEIFCARDNVERL